MKLVDSNKREDSVRTSRRAEYFDALGEKFETYMSDYDVERRQFLIFSTLWNKNLLRGRKVLEVGCGTFIIILAEKPSSNSEKS